MSFHPRRSRPLTCLSPVSQHLCILAGSCLQELASAPRTRANTSVPQASAQPGMAFISLRWDLPAMSEPTARFRMLQGFGIMFSSIPVFCSVFRKPPAREHTHLQHNSPSSPGPSTKWGENIAFSSTTQLAFKIKPSWP